jgi:hypothetical protein
MRLYYLLLEQSRWFAQRNAEWSGYKYAVPSQHKGEFKSLKVIGDKKGGDTSKLIRTNPGLLRELAQLLSVPIKVIHVVRHPFDNIATISQKDALARDDVPEDSHVDVDAGIDLYFERWEGVLIAREIIPDEHWLTIPLEDFIGDTKRNLAQICEFLQVDYTNSYLNDCSEIVFNTPSRSREEVRFTSEQVERIKRNVKELPFLGHYNLSDS